MKDAEFIELLNLYLDHEITPADAARLEAEVQRSPARRQLYRQYCQMQKACTLLATDFAAEAAEKNVVPFEQPRRASWAPLAWGAGSLLAAAACAAFIFVSRNREVAPAIETAAPVAVAPVPVYEPQPARPTETDTEARALAHTVVLPTPRTELQPVLALRGLQVASAPVQIPQEFQWMNAAQLSPIAPTADGLRFETRAPLKQQPAVFRGRGPVQGNVEMTAFQFQK